MLKRCSMLLSMMLLVAALGAACGGDKDPSNEEDTHDAGTPDGDAAGEAGETQPGVCTDDDDCEGDCEGLTSCERCVCDTEAGACGAEAIEGCCLGDAGCPGGFECVDRACVEIAPKCEEDEDCDGQCDGLLACEACVCDAASGACLKETVGACCLGDEDCEGCDTCKDGVCFDPCDPPCDCGFDCVDGACALACDEDCPFGYECFEGECQKIEIPCDKADDPDAACFGQCGLMGVCTTCRCEVDSATCVPVEEVNDGCCKTVNDCDDGNDLTIDTCPTPGMACEHKPDVYLCPDGLDKILMSADFDQGALAPQFTVIYDNDPEDKVTWQLSSFDTHSGAFAAYFGDPDCLTYFNGALEDCAPAPGSEATSGPVHGVLASADFTLSDACVHVLTFWARFEGEPTWSGMEETMPDQLKIYVADGPDRARVFASALVTEDNSTEGAWVFYVADLTPWYERTVRLEFEFDSVDGTTNHHLGALIDDVQVRTAPSTSGVGPCDAFNPCPQDDDPCTQDGCTHFTNADTGQGFCAYFTPDPACDACAVDADCKKGGDCEIGACGEDGLCAYALDTDCCAAEVAGMLMSWDFDEGLAGWTATGGNSDTVTWQVDEGGAATGSPALWFGDADSGTYADDALAGVGPKGAIRSESFVVQAGPAFRLLIFDLWMSTEFDGTDLASFANPLGTDRLALFVESAGERALVWNSDETGGSTWVEGAGGQLTHEVRTFGADLTPWAGKAVRLVFEFDAVDVEQNGFAGAYLDDVALRVTCAAPCASDADCPSSPCAASECAGGACVTEPIGVCCGPELPPCDDGDPCTADTCAGGLCAHPFITNPECCSEGPVPGGGFDFEDGDLGDLTIVTEEGASATWQISEARASQGTHSLWFGDAATGTYDNLIDGASATAYGSVQLPAFPLPHAGIPVLSFDAWIETEWSGTPTLWTIPGLTFDKLTVLANGVEVWNSYVYEIAGHTCPEGLCQFTPVEVSLEALLGQTVVLELRFDSGDANDNGYGGVYLDDLHVDWTCEAQGCYSSLDCDDPDDPDDTCTQDRCVDHQCVFVETGADQCCYPSEVEHEDFEDAVSSLTLTGQSGQVKWQVLAAADGGEAQAGAYALYYGDPALMSYDNPGQAVTGDANWAVTVPTHADGEPPHVLTWWQLLALDPDDEAIYVSDRFTVTLQIPSQGISDVVFSNKQPMYEH